MTEQLVWDEAGARYYETGVSKGILFLMDGTAAAWSGLVAVNLDPTGGESENSYFDGMKYYDKVLAEDFQATIQAISTPKAFESCEGVKEAMPGVKTHFNKRNKFNLSWRTNIGSDTGEEIAHKIHIAYNCLVQPAARAYATIADSATMDVRSFVITTTPACGKHSYFTFDSRDYDISALETQLNSGVLPKCWELTGYVSPIGGGDLPPVNPDDGCPSVLEDFEEYLPGQTVDDDKSSTDNKTETRVYGRINNGLDSVELPANGAFAANDSDATETGTEPVLSDDDDTSYISSTDEDLGYTIGLPPLAGYVDGCTFELHIRASMSGDVSEDDPDNIDADAQVHISTDAGGDNRVGGFSDGTDAGMGFTLTDVSGTPTDYIVPLNMAAWINSDIDDVVAALSAGAYLDVVGASNNNPADAETPTFIVYEASVVMLNATEESRSLRVRDGDPYGYVENQVYETSVDDGTYLDKPVTASVDFKIVEVPDDEDAVDRTQTVLDFGNDGDADSKPGAFIVEANNEGYGGHKLDVTAVDNFPNNPDDLHTWGDVWNDASDATYAEFGDSDTLYQARGVLPAYTGAKITKMTLHFRASASGGDGPQPMYVELDNQASPWGKLIPFHGGGTVTYGYVDGDGWDIPNDGVIRDYSVEVGQEILDDAGWDSIDDIRDNLIAGTQLFFWAMYIQQDDPPTYPDGLIRVYEAWLEIEDVNTITSPLLRWWDDRENIRDIDPLPVPANQWYTLTVDWSFSDARARVLNRDTKEVLYDHTVEISANALRDYAQHNAGLLG